MKWSKEKLGYHIFQFIVISSMVIGIVFLVGCEDDDNYYNFFGIEINEEFNIEQDSLFLYNGANKDTTRT